MDSTLWADVHAILAGREEAIADQWYRGIALTAFPSLPPPELRQGLRRLTQQALNVLLSAPLRPDQAQAIGAELASLHLVQPETLGRTLNILSACSFRRTDVMDKPSWTSKEIPQDRPNPARMYDYSLGGYHNFAVDRQASEQVTAVFPDLTLALRANRAFLRRAVTALVRQGIDQFLDIGSGIPTVGNVHEAAQALNPAARVVYVDIDPIAVQHSELILGDNPRAAVIEADARQPEAILAHAKTRALLDFRRPLAVLLVAVLHFIPDDREAYGLVHALRDAMPSGSYLALSHASTEGITRETADRMEEIYARSTTPFKFRTLSQVEALFEGLDLLDPGVVYMPIWRPDGPDDLLLDAPERTTGLAGVGRKP